MNPNWKAKSQKSINKDFQFYVVNYDHILNSIPSKTPLNDTKQEAEINSQREKRMEEEKINGKNLGK